MGHIYLRRSRQAVFLSVSIHGEAREMVTLCGRLMAASGSGVVPTPPSAPRGAPQSGLQSGATSQQLHLSDIKDGGIGPVKHQYADAIAKWTRETTKSGINVNPDWTPQQLDSDRGVQSRLSSLLEFVKNEINRHTLNKQAIAQGVWCLLRVNNPAATRTKGWFSRDDQDTAFDLHAR